MSLLSSLVLLALSVLLVVVINAVFPPAAVDVKVELADKLREAATLAGCESSSVEIDQPDKDAEMRVVVRCRRMKEETKQ